MSNATKAPLGSSRRARMRRGQLVLLALIMFTAGIGATLLALGLLRGRAGGLVEG